MNLPRIYTQQLHTPVLYLYKPQVNWILIGRRKKRTFSYLALLKSESYRFAITCFFSMHFVLYWKVDKS